MAVPEVLQGVRPEYVVRIPCGVFGVSAVQGSFDYTFTSLREVNVTLRMTEFRKARTENRELRILHADSNFQTHPAQDLR
jgi:hypothetical protein